MAESERNIAQRGLDFITSPWKPRPFFAVLELDEHARLTIDAEIPPIHITKPEVALAVVSSALIVIGRYTPGAAGMALYLVGVAGGTLGYLETKSRVRLTRNLIREAIIENAGEAGLEMQKKIPILSIVSQTMSDN